MLRSTALMRLTINCQPDLDPVLTAAEVDAILDMYALADGAGIPPEGEGWLGLWDIKGASRKAWLVKASKVVADVDYDVDGAKYTQSQLYAHCILQANMFGSSGTASIEGVGGVT